MEKFFEFLTKPARWVLVIGGFFYATWFAIVTASGFGDGALSAIADLVILIVGFSLLAGLPILVLFKKDNYAKAIFLFLLGYWAINSIRTWFGYSLFAESRDGLLVSAGVFSFFFALAISTIIVLTVLEYAIKKPFLRNISLFVLLGAIVVGLVAGILFFIIYAKRKDVWPDSFSALIELFVVPAIVCFGYLHFFGAPKQENKVEEAE